MRIAMIGQKRTGSREGGVEVVVGELARRMADLGHQVTCYDRMGEGAPSEPYEKDGYRIVPVKALDIKGLSALTSSFAATRAAIKDGADVIHYHAEGPCVPLRFARSADIRTVATIHGLDWQRAKWGGLASKYIKFGEATAAKCADALIVLSRGNQEYFKEAYGREATLIPNGITPEADLPAKEISERLGLTQGSYVLYLGRIVPEKRPELLVEAYKQVKTDKRLVIAGDSSDTDDYAVALKEAAASDPRALFTGHVEGNLLSELYSNAYCYALPSGAGAVGPRDRLCRQHRARQRTVDELVLPEAGRSQHALFLEAEPAGAARLGCRHRRLPRWHGGPARQRMARVPRVGRRLQRAFRHSPLARRPNEGRTYRGRLSSPVP